MSEVFELQMGKTPSRDNSDYWGGSCVWVAIGDMNTAKYISDSKEHITNSAIAESGIKQVPSGCVIMSFKLSVGKVAITSAPLFTNEAIMAFNVKDGYELIPDYIYYYLKGYKWDGVNRAAMGLTLNKASISQGLFSYPKITEQERIVAELNLLTSIIDKQKEQLKELDNLAQSIFYDMFGNPVENEKGWKTKRLGDLCMVERGGSPRPIEQYLTDDKDGINWIKIGDATDGGMIISSTKQRIKPEGAKKSRFVHKGDFLLSNSMSFGKPYILGVDGCIHDGWLVIRDENKVFDTIYLYYYLGSPQTYEAFKNLAVGGVVNNLNKDLVKQVKVAIPPIETQESFAKKIQSIESQKASINRSIEESQKLFDYTMDKYFG